MIYYIILKQTGGDHYEMSEMRFGVRNGAGGDGNYHKNQAPRLSRLGDVDTACNFYMRVDTDYSRSHQQQDKNENQDPHRSGMPKLRQTLESVISVIGKYKFQNKPLNKISHWKYFSVCAVFIFCAF